MFCSYRTKNMHMLTSAAADLLQHCNSNLCYISFNFMGGGGKQHGRNTKYHDFLLEL